MDEVFNHIDLLEKDFFGLACKDKGLGLVSAKCLNVHIIVQLCLYLYVTVCVVNLYFNVLSIGNTVIAAEVMNR